MCRNVYFQFQFRVLSEDKIALLRNEIIIKWNHGYNPLHSIFASHFLTVLDYNVGDLKWFHNCLQALEQQLWFGCKARRGRILRVFNRRATLQTAKRVRLGDEKNYETTSNMITMVSLLIIRTKKSILNIILLMIEISKESPWLKYIFGYKIQNM